MVSRRALVSACASFVPVLGADILADISMLKRLIPAINEKFGLSKNQIEGLDTGRKLLICRLIKYVGVNMAGRIVTKGLIAGLLKKQAAKYLPIMGQSFSAASAPCAI